MFRACGIDGNGDFNMKNLNGWMRLWIVLSVLWILLFTAIFFDSLLRQQNAPYWSLEGEITETVSQVLSTESEANSIRITIKGLAEDIFVKPGTSDAVVSQVRTQFQKLADDTVRIIWWHKFYDYLTIALSFPIISYLLARALHWVWLGFKRPVE